jgi:aryl-alcohol dehydrogenase-like predicted oxidoreductase
VAVAWVLAQQGITSAIVGASRPEQLEATLAGAELKLDEDLERACEEVWWRLPRRPVADGYR